jgi:hypothetical protein
MQFISKASDADHFSVSNSILSDSLGFPRICVTIERKTLKITARNLRGLDLLSEAFAFEDFTSKLLTFCERLQNSQQRQIENSFAGGQSSLLRESFMFIVKGLVIEINFAKSAALFSSSPRTTFC